MPVMRCQKDGKPGYKFGPSGVCFTGRDGKARAAAVGRAINARQQEGGETDTQKIEANVAALSNEELADLMEVQEAAAVGKVLVETGPEDFPPTYPSWVKKTNEEKQLVWGEVYVPGVLDTHGDFMTALEVEKMAHRFLADGKTRRVDVNHDQQLRECEIVESFIARPNDPEFIEGAWVICMKVHDEELWRAIKEGALNGFSMEAGVFKRDATIELEVPEEISGVTDPGGTDQHEHRYHVRFNMDTGEFLGGRTDIAGGPSEVANSEARHWHEIMSPSVTGPSIPEGQTEAVAGGHTHRYSSLDPLLGQDRIRQGEATV